MPRCFKPPESGTTESLYRIKAPSLMQVDVNVVNWAQGLLRNDLLRLFEFLLMTRMNPNV